MRVWCLSVDFWCFDISWLLTLSRQRPLSCRNQPTCLLRKPMDWFLYDNGLLLERVKLLLRQIDTVKALIKIFIFFLKSIWSRILLAFLFLTSWSLLLENSSCVTANICYSPVVISEEINTPGSYFFLANKYSLGKQVLPKLSCKQKWSVIHFLLLLISL